MMQTVLRPYCSGFPAFLSFICSMTGKRMVHRRWPPDCKSESRQRRKSCEENFSAAGSWPK